MEDFPKTLVCSLSRAGKYLMSTSRNQDIIALISIGDVGQKKPAGFHYPRPKIRLEFDDVEAENTIYTAPTLKDIQYLVNFAEKFRGRNGRILIHCFAGVSRSSAAGFIVNCVFFGPGREEDAMKRTLEGCLEKRVDPNTLMISYADQILGRNGKMIKTYDEFFIVTKEMY